MKKIISIILLCVIIPTASAYTKKQVCRVDKHNHKICKVIKIHKKFDGHKVPVKH